MRAHSSGYGVVAAALGLLRVVQARCKAPVKWRSLHSIAAGSRLQNSVSSRAAGSTAALAEVSHRLPWSYPWAKQVEGDRTLFRSFVCLLNVLESI